MKYLFTFRWVFLWWVTVQNTVLLHDVRRQVCKSDNTYCGILSSSYKLHPASPDSHFLFFVLLSSTWSYTVVYLLLSGCLTRSCIGIEAAHPLSQCALNHAVCLESHVLRHKWMTEMVITGLYLHEEVEQHYTQFRTVCLLSATHTTKYLSLCKWVWKDVFQIQQSLHGRLGTKMLQVGVRLCLRTGEQTALGKSSLLFFVKSFVIQSILFNMFTFCI